MYHLPGSKRRMQHRISLHPELNREIPPKNVLITPNCTLFACFLHSSTTLRNDCKSLTNRHLNAFRRSTQLSPTYPKSPETPPELTPNRPRSPHANRPKSFCVVPRSSAANPALALSNADCHTFHRPDPPKITSLIEPLSRNGDRPSHKPHKNQHCAALIH